MAYIYDPITNTFEGTAQNLAELGQVMWHITNRCPLNCSICFTRNMRLNNLEVSSGDIPLLTSLLSGLGVQKIDISGGEPLMYAQLPFLVKQCISNSIAVTITTSGAGTPENNNWVAKHWYFFSRVIVSLDGPKDVHNKLRGSDRAYSFFKNFSSLLTIENCKNLRINTVLTRESTSEDIRDELTRIISSIRPLEWCIIEPFPINKTEFYDALAVDKKEYKTFYDRCNFLVQGSGIKVIRRVNEDYGCYWSLYPDGYLYYSHDNHVYDTKILLSAENDRSIRELVKQNKQRYIDILEEK